MIDHIVVRKGSYHDSAFLMRVTREMKKVVGVENATVLMGTPMNRELLVGAGFSGPALAGATPMDLVVALRLGDIGVASVAEMELARLLAGGGGQDAAGGAATRRLGLAETMASHPEAGVVSVAVPGGYAAYVAHRALDAGRNVFLFSDNVAIEDEVALKKRARDLGLLVMGPDCGTALINGVGLGFMNRCPRGPVGIVGASGTGTQEVASILANAGMGVSHAIGTGSHDLSREVGGIMSEFGLRLLCDDPGTEVLVLVAKHPHHEVADRMHEVLRGLPKPAVVRYLGKEGRGMAGGILYASTLDEAAITAAELAGHDLAGILARQDALSIPRVTGRLIGLFGGGSLASEARLILESRGIATVTPDRPLAPGPSVGVPGNLIVDTGDDFYTVGRPHPMIDQTVRCDLIRTAVGDRSVGVVLIDLVLGDGSHADPALEIAAAAAEGLARRGAAGPLLVASICGTDLDPQQRDRQREILSKAGFLVRDTAASAALAAAAAVPGAVS